MIVRKSTFLSRLFGWGALVTAPFAAATQPAQAQAVDAANAPVEWVRYAQDATLAVTGLLESDSETATRLRAYLDATRAAPDQPTAPLILKLWVDGRGSVSRIDFAPFAHPEPNADLKSLIVGQAVAGAPPKDMLLPLRILIQLPAGERTVTLDEANRQLQPPAPPRRPVTDPLGLPEPGGVNRLGLPTEPATAPPTYH